MSEKKLAELEIASDLLEFLHRQEKNQGRRAACVSLAMALRGAGESNAEIERDVELWARLSRLRDQWALVEAGRERHDLLGAVRDLMEHIAEM